MYKIIEFPDKNVSIIVNNIVSFRIITNNIEFRTNEGYPVSFKITGDINKLYKKIKEFILDNQANLMQIE